MNIFISKKVGIFLFSSLLFTFLFIMPVSAASITVSPPKFEFDGNKGDRLLETVTITNSGTEDLVLKASFADFSAEGESGRPSFTNQVGDSSFSLASWISLPDSVFIIPRGEELDIPFFVDVPDNAESGGHFGTIFFSPVLDNVEGITLQQKVGILLLVRVAGEVREQGELKMFNTFDSILGSNEVLSAKPKYIYSSFPIAFATRFTNTGNVHTKPVGTIEIKNMFGKVVTRVGEHTITNEKGAAKGIEIVDRVPVNDTRGNVLPDSSRTFISPWKGYGSLVLNKNNEREIVWKGIGFGRYRAELNMSYGDTVLPNQVIHFWIIPWMIIVPVLFGLLALIVFIRFLIKRSQKKLKEHMREEIRNENQYT